MEQAKLDEVIQKALILMKDLGVSESNLQGFKKLHFKRIQRYFYESGGLSFSINLLDSYQKHQEDRLQRGLIGTNSYTISIRAVKILKEVSQTGALQWRVYGSGPVFKVNSYYQNCVNTFLSTLQRSATTKRHMDSRIRRFLNFLENRGKKDFSEVTPADLTGFLAFIYPFHKGDIGHTVHALRVFIKFLVVTGFVGETFLNVPLQKPAAGRKRIVPCFTHDEVLRIMNQVDRNSLLGKRDYAILYLAAHTGLRGIDIANLRLKDIDWINDEINIFQKKTAGYISLPLEPDTGNIIAEYILHGRPQSTSEYLFLRGLAPYSKLGDNHSINIIIVKYMKLAGISHQPNDGKSFHAFRRSLGTWMLECDTPLSTISQVLGHKSMNSAKPYLSMSERKLSECALGFGDIPIERGIYS